MLLPICGSQVFVAARGPNGPSASNESPLRRGRPNGGGTGGLDLAALMQSTGNTQQFAAVKAPPPSSPLLYGERTSKVAASNGGPAGGGTIGKIRSSLGAGGTTGVSVSPAAGGGMVPPKGGRSSIVGVPAGVTSGAAGRSSIVVGAASGAIGRSSIVGPKTAATTAAAGAWPGLAGVSGEEDLLGKRPGFELRDTAAEEKIKVMRQHDVNMTNRKVRT